MLMHWMLLNEKFSKDPDRLKEPGADMTPNTTQIARAIPTDLLVIGKLLREQDNRYTDQPMFVVQERREYVGNSDYDDCRIVWRRDADSDHAEVSELRAQRLESIYQSRLDVPDGYERFEMMSVWETVTACFTEQGCKDYLAANRHNHRGELHIYADGSYRNFEFRALRNWLMTLPDPVSVEKLEGDALKLQRVADVNKVIGAVSRHGRRFFWNEENNDAAKLILDESGFVSYVDHYTGAVIPVKKDEPWNGFSNGGTLKQFVIGLAEYVYAGETMHIHNIGLPRANIENGYIWGYSQSAIDSVLAEIAGSPVFRWELTV